jgi:Rps23 Pro-64 3,4-dihydroxylase Tpa1-like proline 4-hydroxylase
VLAAPAKSPHFDERSVGERGLWVSDEVVDLPLVGIIEKILRRLPLYRTDYDNEASADVLHLKHEFALEEFDEEKLLGLLRDRIITAVNRLYPEHDLFLHRVHLNESVYGEIVSAHRDAKKGVTALYSVNSEWRDEWEGETLYYANEEPVTAVAMRPGRVTVFPADIYHRSGVASRLCKVARMTLAFKFRATKEIP